MYLTVIDKEAKEILEVRFGNPRTFYIRGDFYLRIGRHVEIVDNRTTIGDRAFGGNSIIGENEVSFYVDPDVR
jgi:hypothetical protein